MNGYLSVQLHLFFWEGVNESTEGPEDKKILKSVVGPEANFSDFAVLSQQSRSVAG